MKLDLKAPLHNNQHSGQTCKATFSSIAFQDDRIRSGGTLAGHLPEIETYCFLVSCGDLFSMMWPLVNSLAYSARVRQVKSGQQAEENRVCMSVF